MYKCRAMLQGNQVAEQIATCACFSGDCKLSALEGCIEMLDIVVASPGLVVEQSDAPQAYTQTQPKGGKTWIELPVDPWFPAWKRVRRPMARLRLALRGHPLPGVYWKKHGCKSFWSSDLRRCRFRHRVSPTRSFV